MAFGTEDLPFCRISDLIRDLEKVKAQHGDVDVCVRDADTGMELPVGVSYEASEYGRGEHLLMLCTEYHGAPSGYVVRT